MSGRAKYSRRRVIAALVELLKHGASAEQVAKSLAAYLVESKQTREVELYIRDLETAIAENFGVATVRVYSAKRLSQQIRTKVTKLMKTLVEADKIELIETVEPALIGGIVIKTADAELDGSMRTKLQTLRSI